MRRWVGLTGPREGSCVWHGGVRGGGVPPSTPKRGHRAQGRDGSSPWQAQCHSGRPVLAGWWQSYDMQDAMLCALETLAHRPRGGEGCPGSGHSSAAVLRFAGASESARES